MELNHDMNMFKASSADVGAKRLFKLTQRMFVEARSGQDLMSFIHEYYEDHEEYDGINIRVDDLIYQAEEEWTELFGGVTEVEFNV